MVMTRSGATPRKAPTARGKTPAKHATAAASSDDGPILSASMSLYITAAWFLFMGGWLLFFTSHCAKVWKLPSSLSDGSLFCMKGLGMQFIFESFTISAVARTGHKATMGNVSRVNLAMLLFWLVHTAVKGFSNADAVGMSHDGVYFNLACNSFFAFIAAMGWIDGGCPYPEAPTMKLLDNKNKVCIAVTSGVVLVFGVLCTGFQDAMFASYLKGVSFSATDHAMVKQMMFAMGITMIFQFLRHMSVTCANHTGSIHAILRTTAACFCIRLGQAGTQDLVNKHLGWPNDGFVFNTCLWVALLVYTSRTIHAHEASKKR